MIPIIESVGIWQNEGRIWQEVIFIPLFLLCFNYILVIIVLKY